MANYLDTVLKTTVGALLKPISIVQRNFKKNMLFKSKFMTEIKASIKESFAVIKRAPAQRSDYVLLGNQYFAKRLVMVFILFVIFMLFIGTSLIMPFLRGRLFTPEMLLSDPNLPSYSGKIHLINRERITIYDGTVQLGKCNGLGKQFDDKGQLVYEGQFVDDAYGGDGVLYYLSGIKAYEGEFSSNLFNGIGKAYSEGGALVYEGEFSNGYYSGKGVVYFENGTVKYRGDFLNGKYQGEGILFDEEGVKRYSGSFVNGLFDGVGKLFNSDGKLSYEGFFSMGLYSGAGRLYDENSQMIYEGGFLQGLYSGNGSYYINNEKLYEGFWNIGSVLFDQLLGKMSTDLRTQFYEKAKMLEMDGIYALQLSKSGVWFELNYPDEILEPTVQKIVFKNFDFNNNYQLGMAEEKVESLFESAVLTKDTVNLKTVPDQLFYEAIYTGQRLNRLTVPMEGYQMLFYFDTDQKGLLFVEYRLIQE